MREKEANETVGRVCGRGRGFTRRASRRCARRSPPGAITYPYSAMRAAETIRLRWFFRLKWGSGKAIERRSSWPLAKKFGRKRCALFCTAQTLSYGGGGAAEGEALLAMPTAAVVAPCAAAAARSFRSATIFRCTKSTTLGRISIPSTSWCGISSERARTSEP